ncbi:MAG: hypothetical protein ACERKD_05180 [Prolixibacteraceae bacterium]
MIQNTIALIIVGAVLAKVIYSVYKSITVKDKTICGGCASCDLKNELKKKGKLVPMAEHIQAKQLKISGSNLKYTGK